MKKEEAEAYKVDRNRLQETVKYFSFSLSRTHFRCSRENSKKLHPRISIKIIQQ